jgi:hypothetical protein
MTKDYKADIHDIPSGTSSANQLPFLTDGDADIQDDLLANMRYGLPFDKAIMENFDPVDYDLSGLCKYSNGRASEIPFGKYFSIT